MSAVSQGMGGYSFLPPFFGADLPLCLLEQCLQDGCSQVTRHPGTILPGKPAPGKSTCPRPAQRARSPEREAEHPWDTTACAPDWVRLSSLHLTHPSSFPGKRVLPGTSVSPCHTTPALPCHYTWPRGMRAVLAAAGVAVGSAPQTIRGRAGLRAGGQAASTGGMVPALAGKGTRVG